ncbi:MAG TPA: hypothetical protein VFS60_15940, partial [Thermoanaerobaculia bacterium]|nr:hypothetical protein [Thermoanaerobaculia bacterium]
MTIGRHPSSARRALLAGVVVVALAALVAAGSFAQGEGVGAADGARAGAPVNQVTAVGPDVTVFAFTDIGSYGSSGGYAGYAIGTRSCNRGDSPLNWCDQASGCAPGAGTEDHP